MMFVFLNNKICFSEKFLANPVWSVHLDPGLIQNNSAPGLLIYCLPSSQ